MSKKHVKFDQGLEFLILDHGDRGKAKENHRKLEENIRKLNEHLGIPGSRFLLNIFLVNIFGVFPYIPINFLFPFFGPPRDGPDGPWVP